MQTKYQIFVNSLNVRAGADYTLGDHKYRYVLSFQGRDLVASLGQLTLDHLQDRVAFALAEEYDSLDEVDVDEVRTKLERQLRAFQEGTSGLHVIEDKHGTGLLIEHNEALL